MMKAPILLLILVALSASKPVIVDPQTRYFGDVAIVPYEVGQSVAFSYSYHSFQKENAAITITLTCGSYTNVKVYTRPSALVALTLIDTVTIPGGFLTSVSATLKLSATGSGFTSSKTLNLTAKSHAVIEPSTLTNGTYVASGKVATLSSEGGAAYYTETLRFSGFQSLYETISYHRLNLPELTLSYSNNYQPLGVTELEAEFYLNDPKGLFFKLPFDSINQAVHLNARFALASDGLFHFAFTDAFYVDRQTLTMSLQAEQGYTSTSFLYFPKNHFSDLQTVSGRLKVAAFGINALTINFPFSHEAGWTFFGDCASAAYCVVVETETFDIGYDYTEEGSTYD